MDSILLYPASWHWQVLVGISTWGFTPCDSFWEEYLTRFHICRSSSDTISRYSVGADGARPMHSRRKIRDLSTMYLITFARIFMVEYWQESSRTKFPVR